MTSKQITGLISLSLASCDVVTHIIKSADFRNVSVSLRTQKHRTLNSCQASMQNNVCNLRGLKLRVYFPMLFFLHHQQNYPVWKFHDDSWDLFVSCFIQILLKMMTIILLFDTWYYRHICTLHILEQNWVSKAVPSFSDYNQWQQYYPLPFYHREVYQSALVHMIYTFIPAAYHHIIIIER